MKTLTPDAIDTAMFSSVEGYAMSVIDSLEFELERRLTDDEQQAIFRYVEDLIAAAPKMVLPVATLLSEPNIPEEREDVREAVRSYFRRREIAAAQELLAQNPVCVSVEGWAVRDGHHIPNTWHMCIGDNLYAKTTWENYWKKWHTRIDHLIYTRDGYWRRAGIRQQEFLDMLFDAAARCGVIVDRHALLAEVKHA